MPDQPWLRRVELYIGPLEEWRGGGNQKLAVKIIGDGTTENLRVRFEIRKSIQSVPGPSQIYVYNLSAALRNSLQQAVGSLDAVQSKPGAQVELKVGWENTPIVTLYKGTLYAVVPDREGPDIVTTLICLAGFGGTSRGTISQTWAGGTNLSSIIRKMAEQIPGITIGSINVSDYSMGNQGYSFASLAKDGLNKLARTYGFSWWIDKNVFYALDDKQALQGREVLISYKNGTLFRAEPMLASPFPAQIGVNIRALLNPHAEAGYTVRIESQVNPQLNKSYKIHDLVQTGDTHSTTWDMSIASFLYNISGSGGNA